MAAKHDHAVRLARITSSPPGDHVTRPRLSFSATSSEDRDNVKLPKYANTPRHEEREDREGGSEEGDSRPGSGLDISHNWMLRDALERSQKQFESRKAKLFITLPDEDAMVHIERRLAEIRRMARPRRLMHNALEDFSEEMQQKIQKVDAMSPSEIRVLTKHTSTNARDLIRWAGRMVILLYNGTSDSERYFIEPKKAQPDKKRRSSKFKVDVKSGALNGNATKSSLTREMQLQLTARPRFRTNKCLKKIVWLLRATKAFTHLFPADMELEVARQVAYERYDDGRIIARQGRLPDRIYYVIGGRMAKLRTYNLWTGHITKTMAYLTKGMTTDLNEMEQQWVREDSLVAMGDVEVLFLDKEACDELSHTKCGPPFEFLRTLDLFQGFPDQVFTNHADAFEVSYFAQNKVVVKDSNRTPWLHVIKSGHVKVIRRQSVFDAAALNQNTFRCSRVEQIGCGRQFSHASAMLGVQAKQKKLKAARTAVLPSIKHTNGSTGKAYTRPTGIGVTPEPRRCSVRASVTGGDDESEDNNDTFNSDDEYTVLPAVSMVRASPESAHDEKPASPPADNTGKDETGLSPPQHPEESSESDEDSHHNDDISTNKPIRLRHHRKTWLNIPLMTEDDNCKRSALWLTRGATELTMPRPKKETQYRAAYLELDTLNPGDVFGLDRMQQARASDPQGLCLLSDGAEIVRVNKRFFLQYACNNAMLKIETNQKEYISEDDAKRALYDKETWEQYKTALWQRISAMHSAPLMSSR